MPKLCNLALVGPFMIKTILGDEKIPNWRASILVLFKMAMGTRWQCCSLNDSSGDEILNRDLTLLRQHRMAKKIQGGVKLKVSDIRRSVACVAGVERKYFIRVLYNLNKTPNADHFME